MTSVDAAHRQRSYGVRVDWGLAGAEAVVEAADVAVVVDVLSFTTTLSVAVDLGCAVLPYRWADSTASGYAREHGAVLAVGRSSAGPGDVSLSPASLRSGPAPARLVLPSPNGSTIASTLGLATGTCLGASLRNAAAVGSWIAARYDPGTAVVAVVAAGEQWPGGSLRPAVEDLWGAGAVVDRLARHGWRRSSPEAAAARAAWLAVEGDVLPALLGCASGQELVAKGWRGDVEIAAEVSGSRSVPLLQGPAFRDAPSRRPAGGAGDDPA